MEGIASAEGLVPTSAVQSLLDKLVTAGFFDSAPTEQEVARLAAAINGFTNPDMQIAGPDLYASLNRAVSSNNIEGKILLRVSKFFTGIFAIFMGFLAVFLQTLDFSLGWVYMSMGVIIGSAVGPASLTILMETANGKAIAAGAVGGLVLGVMGWCIKASVDNDGVISYDTLGQDWPWVVGNLCAILGGLLISLVGSLAMPDTEFKWSMLNERIPLVDDIEPPKDSGETEEKLAKQVKIAVVASIALTIIMLVLLPLPMHWSGAVMAEGGFGFWVGVEMLWAIVAGIVIIGLPLYETIKSFMENKAAKANADAKKASAEACSLPDGSKLQIPAVGEENKQMLQTL